MATKEWLWVPVQVKGGIFGNSLLNKSYSECWVLSYNTSLTSLYTFWKFTKSQALTFPMGEVRHLEKNQSCPACTSSIFFLVNLDTFTYSNQLKTDSLQFFPRLVTKSLNFGILFIVSMYAYYTHIHNQ